MTRSFFSLFLSFALYPWLGKCGHFFADTAGRRTDANIGENTRTPALRERKDRTSPKVRTHNLEGFVNSTVCACLFRGNHTSDWKGAVTVMSLPP